MTTIRKFWRNLIFILIFTAFYPCGLEAEDNPKGKLATVGNQTVSVDLYKDYLKEHRKSPDTKTVLKTYAPKGRKELLEKLIDTKLFAQLARDKGLDKIPEVQRAIEIANDTILAEFLFVKDLAVLSHDEVQLRDFYEKHTEYFRTGMRVKARHVNTKTEKEIEAALKEVKSGKDFAQVASKFNIDTTKSSGGDLGWVRRGIMVKPFEEALFSLKPGEVSDVVKTNFGYHIIKAEEIDEGKLRSFETAKDAIEKMMIDEHLAKFKEELLKKYPVTINKFLLEQIVE